MPGERALTAPQVIDAYSAAAIKAIETNFQVVARRPISRISGVPGHVGQEPAEAYVGQLPAKDVLKKTQDEWGAIAAESAAASSKTSSRATRR